jgi:hypothetical protein
MEEYKEFDKKLVEKMKEQISISEIKFHVRSVSNDLDDIIKNKKTKLDVFGSIKVDLRKDNAMNVLGQDVKFEETVELDIPDEIKEDFINLWEKVKNLL